MSNKISYEQNALNDLKIIASNWIDDAGYSREEVMTHYKGKLKLLFTAADFFKYPLQYQEDLIKEVLQSARDLGHTQEQALTELGLYAMAWDELLTESNLTDKK